MEKRGADLLWIRFRPESGLVFEPGQYFSLWVPGADVYRLFSFCSAPGQPDGSAEAFIRLVEGGKAAQYLSQMTIGTEFKIRAAYGDFTLNPKTTAGQLLFISTGTGLGPLRSMLMSPLFKSMQIPAFGLFGLRSAQEIAFAEDFQKLGIEYRYCVSGPGAPTLDLAGLPVFRGRVTEYLARISSAFAWADTEVYVCGNPSMIQEVTQFLSTQRGVDRARIHHESFTAVRAASILKRAA